MSDRMTSQYDVTWRHVKQTSCPITIIAVIKRRIASHPHPGHAPSHVATLFPSSPLTSLQISVESFSRLSRDSGYSRSSTGTRRVNWIRLQAVKSHQFVVFLPFFVVIRTLKATITRISTPAVQHTHHSFAISSATIIPSIHPCSRAPNQSIAWHLVY